MRPISLLASLPLAWLCIACGSPAPEPTLYLLRGEPTGESGPVDPQIRAGLGRIIIGPYLLTSRGIVVETAAGEVRAANHHQWAESLESGMRWYLQGEIARALGYPVRGGMIGVADWDYTIDIFVARLHGTLDGTARLDASYTIRSGSPRSDSGFKFEATEQLDDDGYRALVAAERRLLDRLAEAIAGSLRTVAASASGE